MRSLLVRSPWSMVRCGLISAAILFGWLVTIYSSPAQETSPPAQEKIQTAAPAQEKKPSTAPTKGGGPQSGAAGTMSQMQGQMKGMGQMSQMKGMMGGRMGMMGKMGGGMEPAQTTEPTLEEMLNKALKDNPDIRVAEAKVREAEAELNRTRLQVTQKVL